MATVKMEGDKPRVRFCASGALVAAAICVMTTFSPSFADTTYTSADAGWGEALTIAEGETAIIDACGGGAWDGAITVGSNAVLKTRGTLRVNGTTTVDAGGTLDLGGQTLTWPSLACKGGTSSVSRLRTSPAAQARGVDRTRRLSLTRWRVERRRSSARRRFR